MCVMVLQTASNPSFLLESLMNRNALQEVNSIIVGINLTKYVQLLSQNVMSD